VRIAKFEERRCLYKSVRYEVEAVAMSFEISNYKRLLDKKLGEWIPELVAVVYVMDKQVDLPLSPTRSTSSHHHSVFDEEEEDELVKNSNGNGNGNGNDKFKKSLEEKDEEELKADTNIHYIGALFQYYPQRDLTLHYATAPLSTKLNWMYQLISAIAALESVGFEHWDLKCENIVLDTSMVLHDQSGRRLSNLSPTESNPGRLKIIDLENSKASLAWQPPPDSPVLDKKRRRGSINVSMVYALGKTVLELFLGRVPEQGEVQESVLASIPEVPRRVVKACCQERLMTARQVEDMIRQYKEPGRRASNAF